MSRAGYQPLPQTTSDDGLEESDQLGPTSRRRARRGSIDLRKLDNAFKRWTESIAQKMKRQKKPEDPLARKEIWRSVFEPAIPGHPFEVKTFNHKPPMTQAEFDQVVQSIRDAIAEGIHPKMITKGSSGSYFARAKDEEGRVHTVAVFKPKDEEPYGNMNPKTTKWLHRQFRWILPFGRACLIPNLSYVSEAAASLLDTRLNLNIVPPTQIVSFASPAFYYDWIDRNGYKKGKPLPEKIGSLQFFLHGFQDASDFLRKHPWPGRAIADTFDDSTHRHGGYSKRFFSALKIICGKTGDIDDDSDYDDERLFDSTEDMSSNQPFYWSTTLQQSFREELEKLVILDYLMQNTDRGADNYMIKYCEQDHGKPLVDVAPSSSVKRQMTFVADAKTAKLTAPSMPTSLPASSAPQSVPSESYTKRPHIHIAAIDNSLSFPHEHPKGWRSYTYGWLYLPVSLIGREFSEQTRNHFLPLLTSKSWWEETTYQLRKLHAVDPDFHPKMFRRQMAVMKGQAWNIVQSLKHMDEGPLELTRRQKVLVWDDDLELPENKPEPAVSGERPPSPPLSIVSVPLPRRGRSNSTSDFPPPISRVFTDASGTPRPVPFSVKFSHVSSALTGVSVLEHLERLDEVEASLRRLGVDQTEEADVGDQLQRPPHSAPLLIQRQDSSSSAPAASSVDGPMSPLPTVHEDLSETSSVAEEDLVAMSKSTSYADPRRFHTRWASHVGAGPSAAPDLDWIHNEDTPMHRTVVVERLETVDAKPLFSCW